MGELNPYWLSSLILCVNIKLMAAPPPHQDAELMIDPEDEDVTDEMKVLAGRLSDEAWDLIQHSPRTLYDIAVGLSKALGQYVDTDTLIISRSIRFRGSIAIGVNLHVPVDRECN